MVSVLIYGFARFPDAPIRECAGPGGYCGKHGKPHTEAEYRSFATWQSVLFSLWPLGMLALFLIWLADRER